MDPNKNCVISESRFISVFTGPLRNCVGLSDQEIAELADYFRQQDGRINYTQLCEVLHEAVPEFAGNKALVTGLEWDDPMHANRLSNSEERRLSVLLTKIASVVNFRRLILRPFFQDYELIAKNNGVITITHFARILAFLNILLSVDDFNLLIKKYLVASYAINYIAFLHAIDQIVQYLNEKGILDLSGDILSLFPGKIINAELPRLPRPEIGKILASSIFGKQTIFHPALSEPNKMEPLLLIIRRIQRHVLENRIRVYEFFVHFDALNSGKITCSQFHRGLDNMGFSGLNKIFLSLPEIEAVSMQYRDPSDPSRVCWRTFENDINEVFTTKELEKTPMLEVNPPPKQVEELRKKGGKNWQNVNILKRELCEEAVNKVKQKTMHRRILLKPVFRDFDKHNNGHVTRSQMRQCLLSNGILLSEEELFALEERFNNDMGFNYFWFLREVDPKPYDEPLYIGLVEGMKKLNAEKPKKKPTRDEQDIVQILAKIKGKIIRERIRVKEFLEDYDRCGEQVINRDNFKRGLANCRLPLTENEVETLMDVFASPMRRHCVDYKRFSDVVEEAFTQPCLDRAPLVVPLQHVPSRDCERNFLNFDERNIVSIALQKLSKKPDLQMNILSVFRDFDKTNCGTISVHQFLNGLSLRGMMAFISQKEFDVICKCFSYERGMRDEVDYRAFMKALDVLYATDKYNPI